MKLQEPSKLKFSMALIEAGFTAEFVQKVISAVNEYDADKATIKGLLEALKKALAIADSFEEWMVGKMTEQFWEDKKEIVAAIKQAEKQVQS